MAGLDGLSRPAITYSNYLRSNLKKQEPYEKRGVGVSKIIENIISLEWDLTNRSDRINKREPCMCDKSMFIANRMNILNAWPQELQESYYQDLCTAQTESRNPISEKYGYMLEQTTPVEFERIKNQLPERSLEQLYLMDWISERLVSWQEGLAKKYPRLVGNQSLIRKGCDNQNKISFETYVWGELSILSEETLRTYAAHIEHLQKKGINLNQMIFENAVAHFGYKTLDEAELFLTKSRP